MGGGFSWDVKKMNKKEENVFKQRPLWADDMRAGKACRTLTPEFDLGIHV